MFEVGGVGAAAEFTRIGHWPTSKHFGLSASPASCRDDTEEIHHSTQHNGLDIHTCHEAFELPEVGVSPGEEGAAGCEVIDHLPQGPGLHEARRAYPSEA